MKSVRTRLAHFVPALDWLRSYRRSDLAADALAGTIVAVLLVPQAMAYAMLAGLPPEVGLYASIAPLVLYALLGTSRTLAVGPVAVVSLLVASGLAEFGALEPSEVLGLAALLALAVGVVQLGMGLLHAGFLVNFLSHPVVSGFTSAAALVIAFSQADHLLGISGPRESTPWRSIAGTLARVPEANPIALVVGALALVLLVLHPRMSTTWLMHRGAPNWLRALLPRAAPLLVVVLGTLAALTLGLPERAGLAIVGEIPSVLPRPSLPVLDLAALRQLAPTVMAISLVGFLESFAVAQALATRRRESVDGSQELVALGVANLGSALFGGYPVTGGFSRSMVNFSAGARTGVASIVTALLVALTLVALTPLMFYLPRAVLAAIIIVAVLPLVDLAAVRRAWAYSRADGAALIVTFAAVFVLGVELGIIAGVVFSLVVFLARSSRPHLAVVGRVGDSENYRNIERHAVQTDEQLLALRIDESLYFGNVRYLEQRIHARVGADPKLRHVLLIASGINFVDVTGLECLEQCVATLARAGVDLHLAEVKGPVMDRLEGCGFADRLGRDHFHLSTHAAFQKLASQPVQAPVE